MDGMSRKAECRSRCPTSVGSTLAFVGSANRSGHSCSLCICNWFLFTTTALFWSCSFMAHVLEPGKGAQFCSLSELFGLLHAFHISAWLSGFSEFISSWKRPLWWELEFLCGEQTSRQPTPSSGAAVSAGTPGSLLSLSRVSQAFLASHVRLFHKSMPHKWRVLRFSCRLSLQSYAFDRFCIAFVFLTTLLIHSSVCVLNLTLH